MTAITAGDLVSSNSRQRVAGARRTRAGDLGSGTLNGERGPGERGVGFAPPEGAELGATWRQQQLVLEQDRVRDQGDRPTSSARQVGLVGIAQAREALAEAVRRAESRAETKAA